MDRDRNDRGPGLERPWTGKMVNLTPDWTVVPANKFILHHVDTSESWLSGKQCSSDQMLHHTASDFDEHFLFKLVCTNTYSK